MSTCTVCGSADWIASDPGEQPVISESTDIVVHPGRKTRFWCLKCLVKMGKVRTA